MRRIACHLAIFVVLLSTVVDPLDARSPGRKEIDRTAENCEPHRWSRDVRRALGSRSVVDDDLDDEIRRDPTSRKTAAAASRRGSRSREQIFGEFLEELEADVRNPKQIPIVNTIRDNTKVKFSKGKPVKTTTKVTKQTDEGELKSSDTDSSIEALRSEPLKPESRILNDPKGTATARRNSRTKGQPNYRRSANSAPSLRSRLDPPPYNGKRSATSRNRNTNTNTNTNINNNVNDIVIENLGPLKHRYREDNPILGNEDDDDVVIDVDTEKEISPSVDIEAAIVPETPENAAEDPRQLDDAKEVTTNEPEVVESEGSPVVRSPKKPRRHHRGRGHGKKRKRKQRKPSQPRQPIVQRKPSDQQESSEHPKPTEHSVLIEHPRPTEEGEGSKQQGNDDRQEVDTPTTEKLHEESTTSANDNTDQSEELSPSTTTNNPPAGEVELDPSEVLTLEILELLLAKKEDMSSATIRRLKSLLDELDVEDKRQILQELQIEMSEEGSTEIETHDGRIVVITETTPQTIDGDTSKPISEESEGPTNENENDVKSSDGNNETVGATGNATGDETVTDSPTESTTNDETDETVHPDVQSPEEVEGKKSSNDGESNRDDKAENDVSNNTGDDETDRSGEKATTLNPENAHEQTSTDLNDFDRADEKETGSSREDAEEKKDTHLHGSETGDANDNVPSVEGAEGKQPTDGLESHGVSEQGERGEQENVTGSETAGEKESTNHHETDGGDLNKIASLDEPDGMENPSIGEPAEEPKPTDVRESNGVGENPIVPSPEEADTKKSTERLIREKKLKAITEEIVNLSRNRTTRRSSVADNSSYEGEPPIVIDVDSDDEVTVVKKYSEVNRPRGRQTAPPKSRIAKENRQENSNVNTNVNSNVNSNTNSHNHRLSAPSRRRLVAAKASRRSSPQEPGSPETTVTVGLEDSASMAEEPREINTRTRNHGRPSRTSKNTNANKNTNINTNRLTLHDTIAKKNNMNSVGDRSHKAARNESDVKNTRRSSFSRRPRQKDRLRTVNSNSNINNFGAGDEYDDVRPRRRSLDRSVSENVNTIKNVNKNSNTNAVNHLIHGNAPRRNRSKDGAKLNQKSATPSSVPSLGEEAVGARAAGKLHAGRNVRGLHKRHDDTIYLER